MKEMPRVVQVGLDVVPRMGGTTAAAMDFHTALGGEIISFTRCDLVPPPKSDGIVHVPVLRNLKGRLYGWSPSTSRTLAESVFRTADLAIVHGLFRYHAGWARVLARKARIPYWVVPHGALDPYVFSYRRWQKELWMSGIGHRLLRDAGMVIYATAREREKAAGRTGSSNSAVVHWPVEVSDPREAEPFGRSLRLRLGIPEGDRVLLALGRLHPSKRLLETIAAMAECCGCGVHLIIAGPDSEELGKEACQEHAASLGATHVHVVGPAFGEAKLACFAASDGLISLSYKENFGYAVGEALSWGLPVLLSPGNDLGSELRSVHCGWVLETFSRAEATAAIRRFATVPREKLMEMGSRGRSWALQEVSHSRFASRLQDLAAATVANCAAVKCSDARRERAAVAP